jgi:hypothetical protein
LIKTPCGIQRGTDKNSGGGVMAEITDIGGQHKCAHEQCRCEVSTLETYCSDYCSDADDQQEVELQCDCKHASCALNDGDPLSSSLDQQE